MEAYRDVARCPRCGKKHLAVKFAEFKLCNPCCWNFWGKCPMTGEPILAATNLVCTLGVNQMPRRPLIGPVRKQIFDAAGTAQAAASRTSHAATKAIHEVSAQYLKLAASLLAVVEDFEENGIELEAEFDLFGKEYKVPIKLNINLGEEDE